MSHYSYPAKRRETVTERPSSTSVSALPQGTALSLVWFEPEADDAEGRHDGEGDTIDACSSSRSPSPHR